jgi:hypothetical protein
LGCEIVVAVPNTVPESAQFKIYLSPHQSRFRLEFISASDEMMSRWSDETMSRWRMILARSPISYGWENVGSHPPLACGPSSQFRKLLPSRSVQRSSGESRLGRPNRQPRGCGDAKKRSNSFDGASS